MKNFVNEGYGWTCLRCRARDDADATPNATTIPASDVLPRFFREGEAEERETRLSAHALARWTDESRTALRCPRCGVEEAFSE